MPQQASPIEYLDDRYPGYELRDRPLPWQLRGLQQTASGYGARLTSGYMARLPDGRMRRVYVTQFSNAGSAWVTVDGRRYYLRG